MGTSGKPISAASKLTEIGVGVASAYNFAVRLRSWDGRDDGDDRSEDEENRTHFENCGLSRLL